MHKVIATFVIFILLSSCNSKSNYTVGVIDKFNAPLLYLENDEYKGTAIKLMGKFSQEYKYKFDYKLLQKNELSKALKNKEIAFALTLDNSKINDENDNETVICQCTYGHITLNENKNYILSIKDVKEPIIQAPEIEVAIEELITGQTKTVYGNINAFTKVAQEQYGLNELDYCKKTPKTVHKIKLITNEYPEVITQLNNFLLKK